MALGKKTGGRKPGSVNKSTAEIKGIAQQYGQQAIEKLAEMAGLIDGYEAAESEQARVAAVKEILDRGYGKATQDLHVAGANGGPILIRTGVPRHADD